MAVTRQENVIRIAADDDSIAYAANVYAILYIPGTGSPTAAIKATNTSGMTLWECSGASRIFEQLDLRLKGSTHFDLAGTGTVLYLYLKS